jgi:hypothetical protein
MSLKQPSLSGILLVLVIIESSSLLQAINTDTIKHSSNINKNNVNRLLLNNNLNSTVRARLIKNSNATASVTIASPKPSPRVGQNSSDSNDGALIDLNNLNNTMRERRQICKIYFYFCCFIIISNSLFVLAECFIPSAFLASFIRKNILHNFLP